MSIFSPQLVTLAETVLTTAREKRIRIVTAESCTGGLVSACLTAVPGSSDVFDRGFVVYSNDAKMTHLDVSRKTIMDFGAVSAETALEMSEGALSASNADLAVSVTGIAGPDGGTEDKPVGLVYIGVALRQNGKSHTLKNIFAGDREEIRLQTLEAVLTAMKIALTG